MCGRFSLTTEEQRLNEFFRLAGGTERYIPRYNGAPTQQLAVITGNEPDILQYFRWGLVPSWLKEISKSTPVINARAETISEKATFRRAFKSSRCLVPADGFYEWSRTGKKQPFRFVMADDTPFAMAGLWESWKGGQGEIVNSFAIITTGPNNLIEPIHNRMPVILRQKDYDEWLFSNDQESLKSMFVPFPAKGMRMYKVSELVNSVKAEGPELIKPLSGSDLFEKFHP